MRCRTTPTYSGLAALEAAWLLSVDPAAPPLARMDWVVQATIRAAMPPGVLDGTADADALLLPESDPLTAAARRPRGHARRPLGRSAG